MMKYLVSAYGSKGERVIIGVCEYRDQAEKLIARYMNGYDILNIESGPIAYASNSPSSYKVQEITVDRETGRITHAQTKPFMVVERGEWVPSYKTVIEGLTYKAVGYNVHIQEA